MTLLTLQVQLEVEADSLPVLQDLIKSFYADVRMRNLSRKPWIPFQYVSHDIQEYRDGTGLSGRSAMCTCYYAPTAVLLPQKQSHL